MGSLNGTSSGSSLLQTSVSDFQKLMEQRKRKRTESNRESARRSRMKKQKHVDDLTAEVARLTMENNRINTSVNLTTELCLKIEGENSILRVQVDELSNRLESLNQIVNCLNFGNGWLGNDDHMDGFIDNSWNYSYFNQPITASADVFFQY